MPVQLIAFDLDGVLVKEPSAWWTLHQAFGTYESSKENLRAYEERRIDYPEFMRRDIRLWGRRTAQEVEAVLSHFTVSDGAGEAVSFLHDQGYQVAIVSAGIDIVARAVSGELGIEHWVANGLEVDPDGVLTGEGVFRVDLLAKNVALEGLIRPLSISLEDVLAVGDSKYDIPFMKACGAAIAFVGHSARAEELPWPEPWPKIHRLGEFRDVLARIAGEKST